MPLSDTVRCLENHPRAKAGSRRPAGIPTSLHLYFATAIQVDEESREFVLDQDGVPEQLAGGLLSDGKKSSILSSSTRDSHRVLSAAQGGPEEARMAQSSAGSSRRITGNLEKKGAYGSSSKLVTKLSPPPAHAGPRRKAPDSVRRRTGAAADQRVVESGQA